MMRLYNPLRSPSRTAVAPLPPDTAAELLRAARTVARPRPRRGATPCFVVYVALLDRVKGSPGYSLYVGLASGMVSGRCVWSRAPDRRYRDEKSGVNAGKGWVRDYGIGLLPDLYSHLNPMDWGRGRCHRRDAGEDAPRAESSPRVPEGPWPLRRLDSLVAARTRVMAVQNSAAAAHVRSPHSCLNRYSNGLG